MTIIQQASMTAVPCAKCGMEFGVPDYVVATLRLNCQSFFCPLGHAMSYSLGKSEAEKLREQVRDLQAARDHENQQRRAAEAEVGKLRKSVKLAKKRAR